jgi:hypothetical protein
MTNRNWISLCVEVEDIEAAIAVYSDRWKLFRIVNNGGAGDDAFATLELIDSETRFRLGLYKEGAMDSKGRRIPSAKHARISLPKSDFWSWVDLTFNSRARVESTPWSADVILQDSNGHMFVIYTTVPPTPDSPPPTPRG